MIVLDDADLEIASSGALWGAFMNAGQTCLSVERCYVHRSLYEPFLRSAPRRLPGCGWGTASIRKWKSGPMIHERQLRTVETQVNDAVQRGARLLAGGRRLTELGPNFYAPTLLADVTPEMRVMQEETFGPVLAGRAHSIPKKRPCGWQMTANSDWRRVCGHVNDRRGEAWLEDQGRNGNGQRHDLLLWHRRGAARRVQAKRHWSYSRRDGAEGDGPEQVCRRGPVAAAWPNCGGSAMAGNIRDRWADSWTFCLPKAGAQD